MSGGSFPSTGAGLRPVHANRCRRGARIPSGHETPRRMRDVDLRPLAGPLPAAPAVPARAAQRLRDLVQRRRGQYDLLRDAGRGHGPVVGRADQPGLPVRPQAAEGDHPRAPPGRRGRAAAGLPGRHRAARAARSRPVGPAAAVVQPGRPRRAHRLPEAAAAGVPVLRRGAAPRVLRGPANAAAARAGARGRRRRVGDVRHHRAVREPAGDATPSGRRGPGSRACPAGHGR